MSAETDQLDSPHTATIALDDILFEVSRESARLAEQCTSIQWSISAILDAVDHPDLGAEIHMLQDIDRIQQTLADLAAILHVARGHAAQAPIYKDEIGSVIRLESLRQRLGLSSALAPDPVGHDPSDITWL